MPTALPLTFARGALTALLAVGVAVIAVGWLAAGRTAGSESGAYREAVLGRPVRINPLVEPASQAEADLTALIFSGLMRLRADGSPEPDLAERWEVTPDQLTYTFHLRSDATWHDGAAFDAEDVAFTIARIQSETFSGPPSLKAQWEDVQVFVDDATTVLIRLPEPAADFLVRATVGLLPEHLAAELDRGEGFEARPFERSPIGTGPYRLTSLNGDRAVLRHNTSYFRGTPPIAELELRFATSPEEQIEWLRAGDVDGALLPETATTTAIEELVGARESLAATVLPTDALTVLYLNNRRGALEDPRTRAALAASLDTEAIVRAVDGGLRPGTGVIPPGSWLHASPERDRPDAEELWAAALWERGPDGVRTRDGARLTLELVTNGEPERTTLAEAIAAQLAEAGVVVELITAPAQRVVSEYLRPGNYDLALFGWETPADPDPYTGWHTSQVTAGNVAAFSDAEADALLEAGRTTLDVAERRELYALFQARFDELGASVVIAYPAMTYVHPDTLIGLEPMLLVSPSSRFEDIERWRLAD
ncbi:MAG: ABC transporter substrate-binding protein [Dehalococcoidia bacterium]